MKCFTILLACLSLFSSCEKDMHIQGNDVGYILPLVPGDVMLKAEIFASYYTDFGMPYQIGTKIIFQYVVNMKLPDSATYRKQVVNVYAYNAHTYIAGKDVPGYMFPYGFIFVVDFVDDVSSGEIMFTYEPNDDALFHL